MTPSQPDVFVRLGQADQVCARKDGTAEVDVFVNLINLPPQDVKVVVDGKSVTWMQGSALHLDLKRVGIGPHRVDVYVAYRPEPYSKLFSVWECSEPTL